MNYVTFKNCFFFDIKEKHSFQPNIHYFSVADISQQTLSNRMSKCTHVGFYYC